MKPLTWVIFCCFNIIRNTRIILKNQIILNGRLITKSREQNFGWFVESIICMNTKRFMTNSARVREKSPANYWAALRKTDTFHPGNGNWKKWVFRSLFKNQGVKNMECLYWWLRHLINTSRLYSNIFPTCGNKSLPLPIAVLFTGVPWKIFRSGWPRAIFMIY